MIQLHHLTESKKTGCELLILERNSPRTSTLIPRVDSAQRHSFDSRSAILTDCFLLSRIKVSLRRLCVKINPAVYKVKVPQSGTLGKYFVIDVWSKIIDNTVIVESSKYSSLEIDKSFHKF